MSLAYDFSNDLIEITAQTEITIQEVVDATRTAEATEQGIANDRILGASGKENLGGAVSVGVTAELLGNWQIHFEPGNYIAKIGGGNLVGGPGGDPVAYSAGVQVLLIQSAASTIVQVSSGSGLSTDEHNKLMSLPDVVDIPTAVQTADAFLDRTDAIEVGITPRKVMKLTAAVLGGKGSGNTTSGASSPKFRNLADTKDVVSAVTDDAGNRSSVTLDLA